MEILKILNGFLFSFVFRILQKYIKKFVVINFTNLVNLNFVLFRSGLVNLIVSGREKKKRSQKQK